MEQPVAQQLFIVLLGIIILAPLLVDQATQHLVR